ncbi:MAG: hypothetical protein WC584_03335 [Candidatus Pacearchaeota archaeon]
MDESVNYPMQIFDEAALRIRDLEEKQRVLRDRLLLIGENLVDIKGETNEKILEIRKDIQYLKQTLERSLSFLESFSSEISNFARKEDLQILAKQAKMFQPMEFVTKKDFEKLKKT